MAVEEIQSYLDSIEEFVYDEKKIVTCSWLAKTLGIHSNLSKQLLHTFFENSPKKDELTITYLIIGQLKNEEHRKMLVVKDRELEKIENQMSLITSKHIFSLQKGSELSDLNVLYAAQKDDTTSSFKERISGIAFKCNQRDSGLIEELKTKALPILSKKPLVIAKKPEPQNNAKVSDTKKPGGTYNLFSKTTSKPKSVPDTPEECNEKTVSKENKVNEILKDKKDTIPAKTGKKFQNAKTGGIGAFFNKANSKPSTIPKEPDVIEVTSNDKDVKDTKDQSPSKENKPTLNVSNEKKTSNCAKKEPQIETKVSEIKSKNNSKKVISAKTKTKKKTQKKRTKETKKRNRLVVLSDSETSSSEEECEVEREPTPEPQPAVIAEDDEVDDIVYGTPEQPTKKRKKKLISKTYMSADGFMETQKVYESFSEEEEAEEKMPEKKLKTSHESSDENVKQSVENDQKPVNSSKKEAKVQAKKNPKNVPSPQKTKQASLMNFFKKK